MIKTTSKIITKLQHSLFSAYFKKGWGFIDTGDDNVLRMRWQWRLRICRNVQTCLQN